MSLPMQTDRTCAKPFNGCEPQQSIESFRVQFQHRLREHLARESSAPEAFQLAWDRTIQDVGLQEGAQAPLYWELVNWARSYDLFTRTDRPVCEQPFRADNGQCRSQNGAA